MFYLIHCPVWVAVKRRSVGVPAPLMREAIVIGTRLWYEFDGCPIRCVSELLASLGARDRVLSDLDTGYVEA